MPGGPLCVRELRLSLAPSSVLTVPYWGSVLPPRPLLWVWGCLGYPALLFAGGGFVPRSVAQLAPCSRWRPLPGWSSLWLRVLGGSWFSPLCSAGRRSASRSTCSALPPVSRLFFGLGAFSLGCGFGLCLTFLLASCGCRCACCDPPCNCESAGVLPSLLGPFPFRGLSPFSHLFLSWRPCRSRSLIPSLAPSWWWPCPLLRWALLTLSLCRFRCSIPSHCRPSCTVSALTVSVLGALFAYAVGRLPLCWFRRAPWGVAVAPPLSPYTGPSWSPPICRVTLGLRSVFLIFLCDIPHVYMAIILSVSLTPACPYLVIPLGYCSLDT